MRVRLTLVKLFVATTLAVALAAGATLYGFLESSRRAIVRRSDQLRDSEALQIGARLSADLGIGATVVDDIEAAMHFGALRVGDPVAVETRLFSALLAHPTISDISLTHAALAGRGGRPGPQIAPVDRWQTSVYRTSADPDSAIVTRRISIDGGHFVADVRRRARAAALWAAPLQREGEAADATAHPTCASAFIAQR